MVKRESYEARLGLVSGQQVSAAAEMRVLVTSKEPGRLGAVGPVCRHQEDPRRRLDLASHKTSEASKVNREGHGRYVGSEFHTQSLPRDHRGLMSIFYDRVSENELEDAHRIESQGRSLFCTIREQPGTHSTL